MEPSKSLCESRVFETFHNVTWSAFVERANGLTNQRFPRLFFACGSLVEVDGEDRDTGTALASILGVVEHWAERRNIDLYPLGQAMTVSTKAQAAATPMASFQVGGHRQGDAPDVVLDDPALPDEAWTAYSRIGVREVWLLDVDALHHPAQAHLALQAHRLDPDGHGYLSNARGETTLLRGLPLDRVSQSVAGSLVDPSPHRAAKRAFDQVA